jgi:hypothetical protein
MVDPNRSPIDVITNTATITIARPSPSNLEAARYVVAHENTHVSDLLSTGSTSEASARAGADANYQLIDPALIARFSDGYNSRTDKIGYLNYGIQTDANGNQVTR